MKLFIAISIFALIGGYLYVTALATGYRGLIFIHGSILFFAAIAIFLRNIKAFLVFTMLVGLAFSYGFYLSYQPPPLTAPPFSSGIRLEAIDVVLIVCYIHWGVSLATNSDIIRPIALGGRVGGLFLAWVLFIFVSGFISATRLDYSLYEGVDYVKGFLLYFYLINNIRDEYDLRIVVYALCAACVIESVWMMFQFIVKQNYMLQGEYIIYIGREGFRSVGFLGTPDACAIILSTIFPIFLVGSLLVKNVFKKFMIVFSILLITVAIMFSQTRITAAVFGIGIITSLSISYRRGWLSKGQILLATTVTILAVLVSIPIVYQRFAFGAYGEERWPLIITAYRIFKAHILFGIGPSNYNFVVDKFVPPELLGKWVFTVHDEYLLRLSETGILGFLIFYSLIITVTARFYRSTFTKSPLIFLVSCGLFASTIGSFVHRLTSIYHIHQVFFLTCTVYALSVIVGSIEKPTVSQASPVELE
ncbi:MAG: O-antigen ligase family protein [Desulfomonilaceae bacterium]